MPTYTDSATVSRILRSSADKKIRISDDALVEILMLDTNNNDNKDASFDEEQVTISSSYVGDTRYKFEMTSDTDFDVFKINKDQRRDVKVDTGSTSSDYTTPDSNVTIGSSAWGGTIESGDIFEFRFFAHISTDDLNSYIDDTEIMVDSELTKAGVDYYETGDTRLYSSTSNTPTTIQVATGYLTAYYIYTDVYRDTFKADANDNKKISYAYRWKRRANRLIKNFIETDTRSSPDVLSFPDFVGEFGDEDVGPGFQGLSTDKDDILPDSEISDIFD